MGRKAGSPISSLTQIKQRLQPGTVTTLRLSAQNRTLCMSGFRSALTRKESELRGASRLWSGRWGRTGRARECKRLGAGRCATLRRHQCVEFLEKVVQLPPCELQLLCIGTKHRQPIQLGWRTLCRRQPRCRRQSVLAAAIVWLEPAGRYGHRARREGGFEWWSALSREMGCYF